MPRTARIVVPGTAHHVTQRGNRRMQTFFEPGDYQRYLDLVREGCMAARVEVLSYCLMPNHVHLVLVPATEVGLVDALAVAHQKYTWTINRRKGWQGYLWQRRFYSCPLDETHVLAAVRYVELNPVRARLVDAPEDWRWSSAPARFRGAGDVLIAAERPPPLHGVGDWSAFLANGIATEEAERLRRFQTRGLPLGSDAFVADIERAFGRNLRPGARGRPPRDAEPRFAA